jgi:hypothetical protein
MPPKTFEQTIMIDAPAAIVERCFTDRDLMHRWLNPLLRCDPIGDWDTNLGGKTRFMIQLPGWQPTLTSVVVERAPGLVVWQFEGFFQGRDCWHCQPQDPQSTHSQSTRLVNRFEFAITNPIVAFGFHTFAARWTQRDMQAQLERLKQVAEALTI